MFYGALPLRYVGFISVILLQITVSFLNNNTYQFFFIILPFLINTSVLVFDFFLFYFWIFSNTIVIIFMHSLGLVFIRHKVVCKKKYGELGLNQ